MLPSLKDRLAIVERAKTDGSWTKLDVKER